jgi:two-component system, OmpR family, sensor kinase
MRSLRTQLVGSTVLLVAALMVVLVTVSQVVLELTAHHEIDRALATRAANASSILQEAATPADAELEPGTRVYDATGHPVAGDLERATAAKAQELAIQALADHVAHDTDGPDDYHLRVETLTLNGASYALVVTQDADPYERSEVYALAAQIVLGAIVVAVAGLIALRVSRRALRPVRQMAERAADWSEHDLAHRFALGPPVNELAALGETLDHLLDRVAAAIRSEQRLTSELAHELRTPLTALRGSAEIALLRLSADEDDPALHDELRVDLTAIGEATRRMDAVITTLLSLARSPEGAQGRCEVADVVARVAPLVPRGLTLATTVPEGLAPVAAPEDLAVRALAPLVENAVRHATSAITLTVTPRATGVEIVVGDDGAGVAEEVRDRLFEPGRSGQGGTGLGLGIARRVARTLGGEIELRDAGRAEFVLTLPRA